MPFSNYELSWEAVRGTVFFSSLSVNLEMKMRLIDLKKSRSESRERLFPFHFGFMLHGAIPPPSAARIGFSGVWKCHTLSPALSPLCARCLVQTDTHLRRQPWENKLGWMWSVRCCPHSKQGRDSAPVLPVHPTCDSKTVMSLQVVTKKCHLKFIVWRFHHRLASVPV